MFRRIIIDRCFCSNSYKNLTIGEQSTFTKKITEQELKEFGQLSGDLNPVHSNSTQKRAVVHGAYLNSLVSSVIGTKLPGPGTLVVKQTLIFPNKCYVNDNVTVTVRILEARKIIRVSFLCEVTEEQKTVLYGDAQLVMDKA